MNPRAALLLLAACAPSLESTVDERRAAIEAQLSQTAAIVAHATAAPAITEPQKITADPPPLHADRPRATDTIELVWLDDLAALPALGHFGGWTRDIPRIARCASLVRTGHEPFDAAAEPPSTDRLCGERAEILLDACTNLRYLGVIRIHELIEPRVKSCGFQFDCDPGYHVGSARGDVLVYRLDTGELLGGGPFTAETTPYVFNNTDRELQNNLVDMIDGAATTYLELHTNTRETP